MHHIITDCLSIVCIQLLLISEFTIQCYETSCAYVYDTPGNDPAILQTEQTIINNDNATLETLMTVGCNSMFLEDGADTLHTDITQSTPAVMRIRESAKIAHEICP